VEMVGGKGSPNVEMVGGKGNGLGEKFDLNKIIGDNIGQMIADGGDPEMAMIRREWDQKLTSALLELDQARKRELEESKYENSVALGNLREKNDAQMQLIADEKKK
jgi:hypothetical protein